VWRPPSWGGAWTLEEHLGVKLLVRTTRRISLTHEGSAFLEDCQRLLSDVANAEASVSAGGVKATGICASRRRPAWAPPCGAAGAALSTCIPM
jgi:DNA-binding transcriptional LysR family regulator